MTIDEIYRLINYICTKTAGAYITPEEFNLFAARANMSLFREKLGVEEDWQPGQPLSRQGYSLNRRIEDDLRPFLPAPAEVSIAANGEVTLPANIAYLFSVWVRVYDTVAKAVLISEHEAELISRPQRNKRRASVVAGIEKKFPIAVQDGSAVNILTIDPSGYGALFASATYPAPVAYAELGYLRFPETPEWAYTTVNNRAVYDAGSSTDFEWGELAQNALMIRILSYVGIELRDGEILSFMQSKKQEGL